MTHQHSTQTIAFLTGIISLFLLQPVNITAKPQASCPAEEMVLNKQHHSDTVRTQTVGSVEQLISGGQQKKTEAKAVKKAPPVQTKHPPQKKKKNTAVNHPNKAQPHYNTATEPQQPPGKNTPRQSRQHPAKISTMINDIRLDFSRCFYHAPTNSVACNMQLTNLAADSPVTFYCYSGTKAMDDKGNMKECAHTWLGSNHSWNFAEANLVKGTPEKAMVRFKTGGMLRSLSMQLVFEINKERKMVTLSNVPVADR